jgi:hypothetical protein
MPNPPFNGAPKENGETQIDKEMINGLLCLLAKGAKIVIWHLGFFK